MDNVYPWNLKVDIGELKMDMEKIAQWAFIIFVIVAILMGLVVGYMSYYGDVNTGARHLFIVAFN